MKRLASKLAIIIIASAVVVTIQHLAGVTIEGPLVGRIVYVVAQTLMGALIIKL